MNPSIPEFGVAVPGRPYDLRPGAYGVLRDADGRIAVAMTPDGGFLPGGGQEPGESLERTLKREFVEETGLYVHARRHIGVADELVYSQEESRYFRKRGTFYEALEDGHRAEGGAELDQDLVWLAAREAIAVLTHESHKWAVRALLAEPVASPNAGPAERLGNSGVGRGPPSVS